jgi:hypothetical protein
MYDRDVGDFVGTWYVKWVTGKDPFLQPNWSLWIGTGGHGDEAARLTESYQIAVGFAILNAEGEVMLPPPDPDHPPIQQPLDFLFVGGTLRWTGFYKDQPMRLYVSLGETQAPTGVTYQSLYASTTWGDPDQVGVWGADGNPPPGGG